MPGFQKLILIYCFVGLLFSLSTESARNTSSSTICDVTKCINSIIKDKSSSNLSNATITFLHSCSVLFYASDNYFIPTIYYDLNKIRNAVMLLTAQLDTEEQQNRKLFISTKYSESKLDPLGGLSWAGIGGFLFFQWSSHLNVPAILFDWDYTEPCNKLKDRISIIHRVGSWATLNGIKSTGKFGFGYSDSSIGCSTILRNQLADANYILLSINFEAQVKFVESYGIFRDHMYKVVENNTRFLMDLGLNARRHIIYRPRLRSHNHGKEDLISDRYQALFNQFAARWAEESHKEVILQVPLDALEGRAEDEVRDFRDVVIPQYMMEAEDEPRKCSGCLLKSALKLVATTFSSLLVNMDDWKRWLQCKAPKDTMANMNILIQLPWDDDHSSPLDKRLETLSQLLETSPRLHPNASLKTIIFKDSFLDAHAGRYSLREPLSLFTQNWAKKENLFGCLVNFGELASATTKLVDETMNNCKLDIFPAITVVVWELHVDMEAARKHDDAYIYYVRNIESKLHNIYRGRQEFSREFPEKEVILKIASTGVNRDQNFSRSFYCDSEALKLNRLYEAMVFWARIHDFQIILRNVSASSNSERSSWWDEVIPPSGTRSPCRKHYVMRNYPPTVTYIQAMQCITRFRSVSRSGIPIDSAVTGVTIDGGIRKEPLSASELYMMLQYASHKFYTIEILPGVDDVEGATNFIKIFRVLKAVRTGSKSTYIQLPWAENDHSSSRLLNTLFSLVGSVKSSPVTLGIHLPQFVLSFNSTKTFQRLQSMFGLAKTANIVLGLNIANCTDALQAFDKMGHATHFSPLKYLICDLPEIPATNSNLSSLNKLWEGQVYLQRSLKEVLPNAEVWFRLNLVSVEGQSSENYLKLVSDLNEFSAISKIKYLLPGFDDAMRNIEGWWRIQNYSDLSNASVFVEKESEVLGGHPWMPTGTWSDREWEENGRMTHVLIFSLCMILLIVTIISVILAIRLKSQVNFLSNEEVNQFFHGGTLGSQYVSMTNGITTSNDALYGVLKFSKEFEISKSRFKLEPDSLLGVGNFGTVCRAEVKGRLAAVKTPKNGCSKENFLNILSEVKILCYIGSHPNVLGFIGCYTKEISQGIIYIATELCENGCLHNYLRHKQRALDNSGMKEKVVDFQELLKFSLEIASGMEYIGEKRIVHGDLSARNVLLDTDYTCKIGDFGLSRKLYEYNRYIKKNQEPLPWRWMAYESLKMMEFTTKSDVWSYSITLWEIFTLGDIPYPGESWTADFVQKIKDGLRIPKPEYGTDEIYSKMLICWNLDPNLRPSFADMKSLFENLRNLQYSSLQE